MCMHGLKHPDSARPFQQRVFRSTSTKLPKTAKTCREHGKASHQHRRGILSTGVPRSELMCLECPGYSRRLGKDMFTHLAKQGREIKKPHKNAAHVRSDDAVLCLDYAFGLLSLTGEETPAVPCTMSEEDAESLTDDMVSSLAHLKQAVENKDVYALTTAVTRPHEDVTRAIHMTGLRSCFQELVPLRKVYHIKLSKTQDEHKTEELIGDYQENVNDVLHTAGCNVDDYESELLDYMVDPMDISIATTCPGCLDKTGKTACVKDNTCKKCRRAKLERAGRAKRKSPLRGSLGCAPPPGKQPVTKATPAKPNTPPSRHKPTHKPSLEKCIAIEMHACG